MSTSTPTEGTPKSAADTKCDTAGDKEVLALAKVLLHADKESDRIAAAAALGEFGTPDAAKALADYFHDRYSGSLNNAVSSALARCGEPGLAALVDLIDDVNTRACAEQALRTIHDPRAVSALENLNRQRREYEPLGPVSPEAYASEIKARAELLASEPTTENLREIGDMLKESSSRELSRWLAKLLSLSGQPGIDVLTGLLGDPRIGIFAMGALRYSTDDRTWEALIAGDIAWLARQNKDPRPRRLRAISSEQGSDRGLYERPKYGFSLRLPAEFGVIDERRRPHHRWLVNFARAADDGGREWVTSPTVAVFVQRLRSEVTPERFARRAVPQVWLMAALRHAECAKSMWKSSRSSTGPRYTASQPAELLSSLASDGPSGTCLVAGGSGTRC